MQSTMHCARKKRQDGQQTKLFHLTICLTGVLRPIIAEIRANTGGERRLTCGSRALFFAQGAARGAKCSPLEMRKRAALMCNNYKKGVCALPHIRARSKRVGLTAHTHISTSRKIVRQSETYASFMLCLRSAFTLEIIDFVLHNRALNLNTNESQTKCTFPNAIDSGAAGKINQLSR
jgi:hypothetical protein